MYIEPNTTIKLLHNVPLDNTYEHTIWFTDKTAQSNYFSSLTKHNLTQQTYQRVQRGVAKVGLSADSCYDCNYMMFQNTNYGNKWFYAFIQKVEYINNTVCEITFEIDVIQTWLFDFNIKQCFVEREHSETDNIGDNIVAENVEIGDVVDLGALFSVYTDMDLCICVASAVTDGGQPTTGAMYRGVYSGIEIFGYEANESGVQSCNNFLSAVAGATMADSIIAVFMMPKQFFSAFGGTTELTYRITKETQYMAGGYEPKNNKLFTYPYSFIKVCNEQGVAGSFPYELFSGDECVFELYGSCAPIPECLLYPLSFKGQLKNYDEGILMNNFPQCAWVSDSYKQWIAQNAGNIALSVGTSVASLAVGKMGNDVSALNIARAGGNPVNAYQTRNYQNTQLVTDVGGGIAGTLVGVAQARLLPPQAHGSTSSTLNAGLDRFNYLISKVSIRPEYAKIIDDYFTVYGYATKRVKVPNRSSRPHWNYVKTLGCVITGSVPSDDMRAICNIHDKGITYWKNGNEIGDYSLDNSPT